MPLPWVRFDTTFPMNHKTLALAQDRNWQAIASYVCSLAYCGAQELDGFVPAGALPFIHGTKRTAEQLVAVGLWIPRPGGWEINGWVEFQATSEENAARSARARAAAQIRWGKKGDIA